jgi:selenocysteine-specific elongation factor
MSAAHPVPVVLGTAGHIDHGKSALIEALCGDHPDRWQEERERGITLDLGYAQMTYPDGLEIGFVDVPGHEKLVRKMVAGATGMGAAMLVVACDDGVMPQTREHFEVLQLLDMQYGIVVLTKADLADEETLELVRADVEDLLMDTTWQEVPVVAVSAHAGTGMDELKTAVRELATQAQIVSGDSPYAFRLPVQRAFALHGAGTVVTGVCASGTLQEGENVEVQPGARSSRVRRVHVHGRETGVAHPGLRTALNLPDVEPKNCRRGAVIAAPGSVQSGRLLRVAFRFLANAPRPKHASEVLLLSGTAALEARIFLPPDHAESGTEQIFVDLELEHDVALVPGDRLLLRRPSPATNLGSGRFLTFAKRRLRKRDQQEREALHKFCAALDEPVELVARWLEQAGQGECDVKSIAAGLGWRDEATAKILQQACVAGLVRELSAGRFLAMGAAGEMAREVQGTLAHWRGKNPHRIRIPMARLRDQLGKQRFTSLQKLSPAELESIGLAMRPGLHWGMIGVEVADDWQADAERVQQILQQAKLMPPAPDELAQACQLELDRVLAVLEYLEDCSRVLRLSKLAYSLAAVEDLRAMVVAQLQGEGIDIPTIRDRFGTTRKFLMPLLEFLDERGVTARRGPKRILRDPQASLL